MRIAELYVVTIVGLVLLPLAAHWVLPFAAPFLVAVTLAALLDAPINKLEAAGMGRGWAVIICLTVAVLIVVGGAVFVLVRLVADVHQLLLDMPYLVPLAQDRVSSWLMWLDATVADLPEPIADGIKRIAPETAVLVNTVLTRLLSAAASIPSICTGMAVAVLATFFLARDGRKLAAAVLENLPARWRARTGSMNRRIFTGVVGYMRAQAVLTAITTCLSIAAFHLFSVPYAWLLGVVAGILDLAPFIGPSVVFIPVVLYKWGIGASLAAAGLGAALLLILTIRQVCEPWLVYAQAGLHPITTLVAIYAGMRVYGLIGILAGPLIALAAKAVWLGILRPAWFSHIG